MTLFLNTKNKKLYTIQIVYSNFPIPARENVYLRAELLIGNHTIRIETQEEFNAFRPIAII